jgi:hypothetical protein
MRVQAVPKKAKLSLESPENLILVENNEDGVIIRAARDNFTERRKILFIRYLAAEGYICDEFQNFGKSTWRHSFSLIWAVERNWMKKAPAVLRGANLFMIRLLLAASILWLALMALAT